MSIKVEHINLKMNAWLRLFISMYYVSVIWISFAKKDSIGVVYSGIIFLCIFAAVILKKKPFHVSWMYLLSLTCTLAALVTVLLQQESPWYQGFPGAAEILFYIALTLSLAENVANFKSIATGEKHLRNKIFYMRKCLFGIILVFPLGSLTYYASKIIVLLHDAKAPGLVESTLDTHYNKTLCELIDLSDDHKFELYDVTPFSLECIGELWERVRINILVIVQMHIAFILVLSMPHWLSNQQSEKKREILGLVFFVQIVTLFFGATSALNRVEKWMQIELLPSVLLTVCSLCTGAIAFLQTIRQQTWVVPFVQECSDCKHANLKL